MGLYLVAYAIVCTGLIVVLWLPGNCEVGLLWLVCLFVNCGLCVVGLLCFVFLF